MPALNRGHIIAQAIQTVLDQTNPNWELVVVDDGSTDGTAEVVKRIAGTDARIHYHYQPNAGPAAARNAGIGFATAPWIAHFDSDDELKPDYLDTMLTHLRHHQEASFAVPGGRLIQDLYQNGRHIACRDRGQIFPNPPHLQDFYHRRVPFYTIGFMHARHLAKDGARFDSTLPGKDDWDMLMRLGELAPAGYTFVSGNLFTYRQTFGSDGRIGAGSYATRASKLEAIWRKHRFDRLMRGQTWYPAEVQHWQELEQRFRADEIPPVELYDFPEYWPKPHESIYNRPL